MALSLPTNRLPQFKILILTSYGWKEIVFTSGELFFAVFPTQTKYRLWGFLQSKLRKYTALQR